MIIDIIDEPLKGIPVVTHSPNHTSNPLLHLNRRKLLHNLRQSIILARLVRQNGLVPIIITPGSPSNPHIGIILEVLQQVLEQLDTLVIRAAAELRQHGLRAVVAERVRDRGEEQPEQAPVEALGLDAVQDVEVLVQIEDDLAVGRFVHEWEHGESGPRFPGRHGGGERACDEDAVVRGFVEDGADGFLAGLCPAEGAEAPCCWWLVVCLGGEGESEGLRSFINSKMILSLCL